MRGRKASGAGVGEGVLPSLLSLLLLVVPALVLEPVLVPVVVGGVVLVSVWSVGEGEPEEFSSVPTGCAWAGGMSKSMLFLLSCCSAA